MHPINILLVEDDKLDVIDIKRSLDKLNIFYKLTNAKNGEEAITLLSEQISTGNGPLPDVMLIDINMPKVNGFEVLEYMRDREEFRQIKRFILTTSGDRTDKTTAEKLGISGYIIKPLKLNSPTAMDAFNLMIDLLNFKKN
ncbi:response regulator [Chitinophaga ginsengisoli]|uniref:Response regulator receiver domain-containing protein n=1 Tax=Chitinophaga ginsengisoli TaxID=363837 RepID=A0A2P8G9J1_9BACT|nr:response regulator [Chitinophaga ginsengisoli]PSL30642.1 response regulator receiver domain-containing protein [Chitinophaga ginsengisoli]